MKSCLPEFEWTRPESLAEALRLMGEAPGQWQPIAGGTDLMVLLDGGVLKARRLLDLTRFQELRGDPGDRFGAEPGQPGHLHRGAGVRRVHRWLPNLVKSARSTGALAIQNRGTLGGNTPTPAPPPTPRPASWSTTRRWTWSPCAAPAGWPWTGSTWATSSWTWPRTNWSSASSCPSPRAELPLLPQGGHPAVAGHHQGQPGRLLPVEAGPWRNPDRPGFGGPVPLRARRAEAVLLGRPLDALPIREPGRPCRRTSAPWTTSVPPPTTGG